MHGTYPEGRIRDLFDHIDINYAHRAGNSKVRPIRDTLGLAVR